MSHIFISYSRQDYAMASEFINTLRAEGLDVWIDVNNISLGEKWEKALHNAIKNANCILVFLSPNATESQWIQQEVTLAQKFHRRIIPIIIAGGGTGLEKLPFLNGHTLDARQNKQAVVKHLITEFKPEPA